MEKLIVGQMREGITVNARLRWNATGLQVAPGESYRVQASSDLWHDAGIPATADGQDGNMIQRIFKWTIRCKQARWFQLVGALGQSDEQLFPLGIDAQLKVPPGPEAELTLFANDVLFMYGNNQGNIWVNITRIA
ncbi:hypothetical protein ACOAPY_00220 [Pseudomonas sp. P3C3]